jgi:hypothetical protein
MRYKAEKRSDGYWVCDTYKDELCLATRTFNQTLAEQWVDVFNTAYAAFRDEAARVHIHRDLQTKLVAS